MTRSQFRGFIAGAGSMSGVRLVVGLWPTTPLGPFADAMVETVDGHRVLLVPTQEVADFIAGTYFFDEVRIQSFSVTSTPDRWNIASPSLAATLLIGRRRPLGWALKAIPDPVAGHPAWCAVTDPIARVALRGVRTRGAVEVGSRGRSSG